MNNLKNYSIEIVFVLSIILVIAILSIPAVSIDLFRGVTKTSHNITLYKRPPKYYQYPPKQHLLDIEAHNHVNNDTSNDSVIKTGEFKCYFKVEYYDIKKSQLATFQCNEDVSDYVFCIFHDKELLLDKDSRLVDNTLNDKINRLIEDGQEVFCIGYNIPFVSLAGKKIYRPIYFHDAKIRIADFRESFFTEGATAYFVNTKFEEASFDDVIFHGPVLFNSSIFNRESQRQGFFYKWEHNYNLAKKYSGYASFRNAEFYDQANFEKTRFYGIAFFDDAKFFENAIFDDSSFNVDSEKLTLFEASFYGNLSRYKLGMGDGKIPYD